MEAKKWAFAVSSIVITAVLSLLLLRILEAPGGQHAVFGDLNIIPAILQGSWSPGKTIGKDSVIAPNLTTCHESSELDIHVYCCPPKNGSDLTVFDFRFPDPSNPLRVRRPTHLLDDNYIAKYNEALTIMKSLPYSDPRSFSRQADLHCLYCTGAYYQQNSRTPLNIHRSWLFFPWHRMMLHFHERILGSLIGDDTFALPFWPWDIPEGMLMPEMYLNSSFFDKERDISHFPPTVVDLDYRCSFSESTCPERGLTPDEQVNANLAFMYNQMVSGAKKTELFMGCHYKAGEEGLCDGPGTIETAPHNTLHRWVGSSLNSPAREDMGVFYSAARDPIFYPHHANIDRLWEVWRGFHMDNDITDPDWLDSFFYFYDEKSQFTRVKIRDVLDITKLRYSFEKVDVPWLNARPKPSVQPEAARQILKTREIERTSQFPSHSIISSDFRSNRQTLDASVTVKVIRPKVRKTKGDREEEEEVLVVHGIDVKEEAYVKFDVYVNVVNETIINPGFREFAGTFVHIPSGVKLARRKTSLKLGISELLQDLEAEEDESIWVTLLPRNEGCINTSVDGIRIEYLR
ncbi:unnamed protein product [Dovyalis caffra]|uniref:Tyrosinase copper-binding domain-containing protein n=1 Tax=Dovyalis caffra TaxID=77055 RepID=A0AAV1RPP7_9ROSI|nr:unnamed protein product [Dovyalis caffra]